MIDIDKIVKRIKKSDNIFVMGHKNIDLDAYGACLAINEICNHYNKKCFVVLEDTKFDGTAKNGIDYVNKNYKYNCLKFGECKEKIKNNSLLILVDTYSEKRSQSPKLFSNITNHIFIDHHLFGNPINEDYFIDSKVSSTCEMLAQVFIKKRIKLNKIVATILLSGIDIDSNNYSIKTTYKTHETVAYLLKIGADLHTSINFTRTKIDEYIKIQKAIFKTEFYKKKYAFVVCDKNEIYERKNLAIISDSLLNFKNVEATFAIAYVDKGLIGVSARSLELNVAVIMEKHGGGGHKNNAACQIENKKLEEIVKMLKEDLK